MKAEHLILSIRATGCSHIFYFGITLTDRRKFYILITVIKINLFKNKNHFYFCELAKICYVPTNVLFSTMNFDKNSRWLGGKQLQPAEARCECGQLIAKLRGDMLEVKCKRCKRIVSISYDKLKESEVILAPCAQ